MNDMSPRQPPNIPLPPARLPNHPVVGLLGRQRPRPPLAYVDSPFSHAP